MSLGLFWLSSVILSDFMFIVTIFRAMKDLVDEGYKLSGGNTNKTDNTTENNSLLMFLILLIPIANILAMLSFSSLVVNNKEILFDVFKSKNMIKEMTKEEIEEYEKNPTLLNAFKTCMKKDTLEETKIETLVFKLSFENISGEIEYILDNNKIKIISSTIDNKYSEEIQRNLVNAAIKLAYLRELKKFNDREELEKFYFDNPDKLIYRMQDFKIMSEDEDKIKHYFLEFELLDKYEEAIESKNEVEKLEKELDENENQDKENEKLELINKLKLKYKELIFEAAKINSYLLNTNDEEENEMNQKTSEERILKK